LPSPGSEGDVLLDFCSLIIENIGFQDDLTNSLSVVIKCLSVNQILINKPFIINPNYQMVFVVNGMDLPARVLKAIISLLFMKNWFDFGMCVSQ
jgi:hypothetical protein